MPLNAKQLAFVREYLIDFNGTQAAVRAGYSERSANVHAGRLLVNASVQEAIQQGSKRNAAKLELKAEHIITGLMRIAFSKDSKTKDCDRIRSLELLGKRFGLFVDKHEVSVRSLDDYSDDELRAMLSRLGRNRDSSTVQ